MRQKTSRLLDPKVANEQLLRTSELAMTSASQLNNQPQKIQHPSDSIKKRISTMQVNTPREIDQEAQAQTIKIAKQMASLSQQPTMRKIPKSLGEEGKLTFGMRKRSLNNNVYTAGTNRMNDSIDLRDKKSSIGASPQKYPSSLQTTTPQLQTLTMASLHRSLVPVLQSNRSSLIAKDTWQQPMLQQHPLLQTQTQQIIDQHQSKQHQLQTKQTTLQSQAKNAQNLTLFTNALERRLNDIYGNKSSTNVAVPQTLVEQQHNLPLDQQNESQQHQQVLAYSKLPLPAVQQTSAKFGTNTLAPLMTQRSTNQVIETSDTDYEVADGKNKKSRARGRDSDMPQILQRNMNDTDYQGFGSENQAATSRQQDDKLVLSFQEHQKSWMSNRTNQGGGVPSVSGSQDRDLWKIVKNTSLPVQESDKNKQARINMEENLQGRSSSLMQAKRHFTNLHEIKLSSKKPQHQDFNDHQKLDTFSSQKESSLQIRESNYRTNSRIERDKINILSKKIGLGSSQQTTDFPTSKNSQKVQSLAMSSVSEKQTFQQQTRQKLKSEAPQIRLNSAQEVIAVTNGEDGIEGNGSSHPPSPNFGVVEQRAKSSIQIAQGLITPVKMQETDPIQTVLATSVNAVTANSVALADQKQTETNQLLTQREPIKKETKRFKSPYEQRLPLLAIKGEIKNQLKQQQQLPPANQQSQSQRQATIINSYRSNSTAIQNSSQQKPQLPSQPHNRSNTISSPSNAQVQQLKLAKITTQKQQNNSSLITIDEYQINNKTERAQPTDLMSSYKPNYLQHPSAPQASMSALDGPGQNAPPLAKLSFYSGGKVCHTIYKKQQNTNLLQKAPQKQVSAMLTQQEQNQTMSWSASKTIKPIQANSILAVSKDDVSDQQLSPMKDFMIERNTQKNQLQGFSDYVGGPTGTMPTKQRSEIDAQNAITQASSQQVRVTSDQNRFHNANSITTFTNNTSMNTNNLISGLASTSLGGHVLSGTGSSAQSRMMHSNKTRQVMRTHNLPNQKLSGFTSQHEQRNSNCIVAGMLTTFQQMSPSKNKQDLLSRPNISGSQTKALPLTVLSDQESSYLKTMVTQANQPKIGQQPSQIGLEKSLRPQLNKFNQQQQTQLGTNAPSQNLSYGVGNVISHQQRQASMNTSKQAMQFVFDTNQVAQSPIQKPGQKKVHKPLSEVRPYNQQHKPQKMFSHELHKNENTYFNTKVSSSNIKEEHSSKINPSNDLVSKALYFQQPGEYYVRTKNLPYGNVTKESPAAQKSYTNLKRVGDQANRAPVTSHLAQLPVNQSVQIPPVILDQQDVLFRSLGSASKSKATTNSAIRKSMDKATNNVQRVLPTFNPVQAQAASSVVSVHNGNANNQGQSNIPSLGIDKEFLFTMIGKQTSYSPRKSRKTSQYDAGSSQQDLQSNKAQTEQKIGESKIRIDSGGHSLKDKVQEQHNKASAKPQSNHKKDSGQDQKTSSSYLIANTSGSQLLLRHEQSQNQDKTQGDTKPEAISKDQVLNEPLSILNQQQSTKQDEIDLKDACHDKLRPQIVDQAAKSTRNKFYNHATHHQQMNTNSSEGEIDRDQDAHEPLSLNHSENNLNVLSATVDGRVSDKNAQNQSTPDGKGTTYRQSTQKQAVKSKIKSHYVGSSNNQNRGRRKRKQTTRSIISSKPSLHSNLSRAHHPQTSQQPVQQHNDSISKQHQPTILPQNVAGASASQPVPAVHDLTNKKFIKDTRRLDNYFQRQGYGNINNSAQNEEYFTSINNTHGKSEKDVSAPQSSYTGSRASKNRMAHKRKESQSIPLSNTRSQPKILIKHSRGSQRSSSAIRSPKLLNNVASSSTTKDGALKAPNGQRQPYMLSNQESALSNKSRPKTVTKAVSAASVGGGSAFSRRNILSGQSESKGPVANRMTINSSALQPQETLKFSAMESDTHKTNKKGQLITGNTLHSQASIIDQSEAQDGQQEQGSHFQVNAQKPFNHLKSNELTAKEAPMKAGKGKQAESQHVSTSVFNALPGSKVAANQTSANLGSASKPQQQQYIINRKETNIVARAADSSNEKSKQTTFKASQVKRVRQIQSSQKTLEIRPKDDAPQALINPIPQIKEPQSAAKTQERKNKLQTAFSMMSRCESTASQNYNVNNNQNDSTINQSARQESREADVAARSSSHKQASMIDEEIAEECGSNGGRATSQQKHTNMRPTPLTLSKPKPLAQVSPYCTMSTKTDQERIMALVNNAHGSSMAQTQQHHQDPRMATTLVPKPGSSMKNQQAARSYQQDEDYIPSAQNQPYCSCKSYVVIDSHDKKVLQSKNKDEVREMASLTKMMTAIVTLELAQDMRMDLKKTYFKVSQKASGTIGTTANLLEGQVLSIWDLLHGLMLPSGNDAAMVLAENFSVRLMRQANRMHRDQAAEQTQPIATPNSGVGTFVKQMNKTARKIHMRATNYANPHGLADKANHSTALEQATLANYGMKSEIFRQIVNTKTYTSINFVPLKRCKKLPNYDFTTWMTYDERDVPFSHGDVQYVQYYQTWYNSNKLLDHPGFCGVKTGQTNTAGCCLAIYYKNTQINKNLITVVLGSKSIEYRWKDTRRLTLWADAILMEDYAIRSASPIKIEKQKKQGLQGTRLLM